MYDQSLRFSAYGIYGAPTTAFHRLSTHALRTIQHITDFILLGFRDGYGSGHGVRGRTTSATQTGIRHFFTATGIDFPCGHPQIRMILKGIHRLDAPVRHKALVSINNLECCYAALDMNLPSSQGLWGSLCQAFSFSFVPPRSHRKKENRLHANDIAILDSNGDSTTIARVAEAVHIRLSGSKTNQHGEPTLRALNRSGHQFLCPAFGALCLLRSRRSLPQDIPAAVYIWMVLNDF
ncbi:LOW QUALITY PROTEIN: hypothetical protein PHMEG_0007059 [Phytophthora megakarya]|uniref:Uncharacterized protein n=1 Tax=Phytophthora megakarya TaxID=4795 RepID=A0A225WNX2_9STRA|nr:LOW QUALITY PROTEIN: hypothetical protein PHMEG_0007059 [Phytophthora megakarya]